MHKKFLVLVFLILLIIFIFKLKTIQQTITGLLAKIAIGIDISIASNTDGEFIYLSYPSQATVNTPVSFETIFMNNGSLNITTRIGLHIKDSSLNTLSSSYDDYHELALLQTRNFSRTWTPTSAGTYWIVADTTYNSTEETKTAQMNASFTVTGVSETTVTPLDVGGGGGAAYPLPAVPVLVPTYVLTLDYPKSVSLAINESSVISIFAANDGNSELYNLSMSIYVDKIEWRVDPEEVLVLTPNTTVIFLISVEVPPDAEQKVYTMDFTLESKETSTSGKILINVTKMEPIDILGSSIKNYELLIEKIDEEIEKAAAEGRNVTLLIKSLREARMNLDLAKYFFELGNLTETQKQLQIVRLNLIKTVSDLASSIIPRTRLYLYLILLIIILIFLVIIVAFKKKVKIKRTIKPMIEILKEEKKRLKNNLKEIEILYSKRQIDEKTYNLRVKEIEKKIEKIEKQIILKFGDIKQLSIYMDLKKAYIKGTITKRVYDKAKEKLADDITSKKISWR